MTRAWRPGAGVDRQTAPIEMRFVDLFMAALGALLFLAMLLAFLLQYVGPANSSRTILLPASPLQLVTPNVPPATVGVPYSFAFSYRGGQGAVIWQLAAERHQLPSGLRFDARQGLLVGTPEESGRAHFVLRIRDRVQQQTEHPYVLVIERQREGQGSQGSLLIGAVTGGSVSFWLLSLATVRRMKQILAQLSAAADGGELRWHRQVGTGVLEVVELPGGVATYETRLRGATLVSRLAGAMAALLVLCSLWQLAG